jgi:hypothetical protein
MDNKNKSIILIIIFSITMLHAQLKKNEKIVLSPVFKSFLLPGWGQHAMERPKRGNIFISSELLMISLSTFSFIKSKNVKDTYIAIAAEYAGTNNISKGHQYWVDIGNYNSIADYNDEHLRWREYDALYPNDEIWRWQWKSDKKRDEFEDLRIESDNYDLVGKFLVGGIILNHIISAIDALYLKNISVDDKIKVISNYNAYSNYLEYSLQLTF